MLDNLLNFNVTKNTELTSEEINLNLLLIKQLILYAIEDKEEDFTKLILNDKIHLNIPFSINDSFDIDTDNDSSKVIRSNSDYFTFLEFSSMHLSDKYNLILLKNDKNDFHKKNFDFINSQLLKNKHKNSLKFLLDTSKVSYKYLIFNAFFYHFISNEELKQIKFIDNNKFLNEFIIDLYDKKSEFHRFQYIPNRFDLLFNSFNFYNQKKDQYTEEIISNYIKLIFNVHSIHALNKNYIFNVKSLTEQNKKHIGGFIRPLLENNLIDFDYSISKYKLNDFFHFNNDELSVIHENRKKNLLIKLEHQLDNNYNSIKNNHKI